MAIGRDRDGDEDDGPQPQLHGMRSHSSPQVATPSVESASGVPTACHRARPATVHQQAPRGTAYARDTYRGVRHEPARTKASMANVDADERGGRGDVRGPARNDRVPWLRLAG